MRYIVHLGAHKTGTTTLQRLLHFSQAELAERQVVAVVDHVEIREAVGPSFLGTDQAAEGLRALLAGPFEPGVESVIYSFEGHLGTPFAQRDRPGAPGLYPRRRVPLEFLAPILQGISATIEIAYTVRRQASLIESYYLQAVKEGSSPTFEEYCEGLVLDDISWVPLLSEIADALGIPITMFEYQSADKTSSVVERMLDRYLPGFDAPEREEWKNTAYSARGLEIALRVQPLLKDKQEQRLLRRFIQRSFSSLNEPPPVLLAPEQREQLDALYVADIAALRSLPRLTLADVEEDVPSDRTPL